MACSILLLKRFNAAEDEWVGRLRHSSSRLFYRLLDTSNMDEVFLMDFVPISRVSAVFRLVHGAFLFARRFACRVAAERSGAICSCRSSPRLVLSLVRY